MRLDNLTVGGGIFFGFHVNYYGSSELFIDNYFRKVLYCKVLGVIISLAV